MNLSLQNSISSPQDLRQVIQELKQYSHWLSQTEIKQRVSNTTVREAPAISEAARDLMEQRVKDKATPKRVEDLVAALEDFLSTAPTMTITLAAPAPGELKKLLIDWCRKNLSQNVLIDFKFNSTILGGMVVRYGSHIYDWSFRRQILAARTKFPEILRRV